MTPGQSQTPSEDELARRRLRSELSRRSRLKECFHADDNCSENIIDAHSISNNRILQRISEEGEVLMPFAQAAPVLTGMRPTGRKTSSTFTGFCGHHDQIFSSIDQEPFQAGNREHEFLYAYRGFAKECWSTLTTTSTSRLLLQETESQLKGNEPLHGVRLDTSEDWLNVLRTFVEQRGELERVIPIRRTAINNSLDNQRYDRITTTMLEFPNSYPLAVSSMFLMEMNPFGDLVNDLSTPVTDQNMHVTYLNVIPEGDKTYVLLACDSRHRSHFGFYDRIAGASLEQQQIIISNMIANNAENVAISPAYWERLAASGRNAFVERFSEVGSFAHLETPDDGALNIFV